MSGRGVLTVHEHDAREVGRNAQALREVVDGGPLGDVERHGALRVRPGQQIREEGGEEPDFDLQRS